MSSAASLRRDSESIFHRILHSSIIHVLWLESAATHVSDDHAALARAFRHDCDTIRRFLRTLSGPGGDDVILDTSIAAQFAKDLCSVLDSGQARLRSSTVLAVTAAWDLVQDAITSSVRLRSIAMLEPTARGIEPGASSCSSALFTRLDAVISGDVSPGSSIAVACNAMLLLEQNRLARYSDVPLPCRACLAVFDFDDTLTCTDTTPLYARMAVDSRAGDAVAQASTKAAWAAAETAYVSSYTHAHIAALAAASGGTSLARLHSYMLALDAFDKSAVAEVSDSKITCGDGHSERILQGIPARLLLDSSPFACGVALREGAKACAQLFPDAHVLSLNWSADFIAACLRVAGLEVPRTHVHANSFQMRDGATTGVIQKTITSSLDKSVALETIRPSEGCIFVGDSIGDLCALVAADVGILLCKHKEPHECSAACVPGKLFEACKLADVVVLPLVCIRACCPAEMRRHVVGTSVLISRGMTQFLGSLSRVLFLTTSLREVAAAMSMMSCMRA